MSSLLELVDELIDINLDGARSEDADERNKLAQRAEEVYEDIRSRLMAVDNFHQPESVRIRSILDGEDKPWFE